MTLESYATMFKEFRPFARTQGRVSVGNHEQSLFLSEADFLRNTERLFEMDKTAAECLRVNLSHALLNFGSSMFSVE